MLLRARFLAPTVILGLMMGVATPPVAYAEDKPTPPPVAAPAPGGGEAAAAAPAKQIKKRAQKRKTKTGLARASGSIEQRHQVCLAFIRRHGLDCDPWQTPTCGADSGYFRPPECVRPRSQQ